MAGARRGHLSFSLGFSRQHALSHMRYSARCYTLYTIASRWRLQDMNMVGAVVKSTMKLLRKRDLRDGGLPDIARGAFHLLGVGRPVGGFRSYYRDPKWVVNGDDLDWLLAKCLIKRLRITIEVLTRSDLQIAQWVPAPKKSNEFETLKPSDVRIMCDGAPGKLLLLSVEEGSDHLACSD
jgi:hypothetical protein